MNGLLSRSGIRERRIVEKNVSTSDLGAQAALRALDAAGLSPEDLDFIITGTNSPDMFFPCTGCFIQAKIGAKKAAAFDVSAGCTSFIHALSLADKFIKEDPSRKVMVLGAEIMSKVTDWTDRGTCVLFGDGAGAVILAGEEGERGSAFDPSCTPTVRCGNCSTCPEEDPRIRLRTRPWIRRMHYIKMAGNQLFKVAVRALADVSQEALKFNGLEERRHRHHDSPSGEHAYCRGGGQNHQFPHGEGLL